MKRTMVAAVLVVVTVPGLASCQVKRLLGGCDAKALERSVKMLETARWEHRPELAANAIAEACEQLPKPVRDALGAAKAAQGESALSPVVSGAFGTSACSDLAEALESASVRPFRERRGAVYDACHFERLGFVSRERFAESYGPFGLSGSVVGAVLFHWMADHGADQAHAGRLARTVAGAPAAARIPKGELPESDAPRDLRDDLPVLAVWPDAISLNGVTMGPTNSDQALAKLGAAFKSEAQRVKALTEKSPQVVFTGEVNVFADRRVPFGTLRAALRTALAAGYDSFVFAAHRPSHFALGGVVITLPAEKPDPDEFEKPKLLLTAYLADDGFIISGSGGVLPGDDPDGPTIRKSANGEYDFPALTNKMVDIKKAFPDVSALRIGAPDQRALELLIRTIDACRVQKDGALSLFPDVTLTTERQASPPRRRATE